MGSEEPRTGGVVSGIDRIEAGLDRSLAVAGEVPDCLAGLGMERFKAVTEIQGSSNFHDATTFSIGWEESGMNVLPEARDILSHFAHVVPATDAR